MWQIKKVGFFVKKKKKREKWRTWKSFGPNYIIYTDIASSVCYFNVHNVKYCCYAMLKQKKKCTHKKYTKKHTMSIHIQKKPHSGNELLCVTTKKKSNGNRYWIHWKKENMYDYSHFKWDDDNIFHWLHTKSYWNMKVIEKLINAIDLDTFVRSEFTKWKNLNLAPY